MQDDEWTARGLGVWTTTLGWYRAMVMVVPADQTRWQWFIQDDIAGTMVEASSESYRDVDAAKQAALEALRKLAP